MRKVNLADALASIDQPFSPRIVAYYNENKVQVAKTSGPFVWHSHPETDDLFLVLRGRLVIEFRDGEVELEEGELYVVPRGVEHRPRADGEAHVLFCRAKRRSRSARHPGESRDLGETRRDFLS